MALCNGEQSNMNKIVGLSLSFCVKDIMDAKVAIDNVQFIATGTYATSPEDWDEVIGVYRKAYWYKDPDRGEAIARHFINNGMILQPRLEGNHPLFAENGKWILLAEYNELARNSHKRHKEAN